MTIAKFDRYDTVNSPKSDKPAFTIWFSGCSQQCKGCYNQKLWDASSGDEYDVDTIISLIDIECGNMDIEDIVLLGGEPLEQEHMELLELSKRLCKLGYRVWLYTGWEIDQVPHGIKQYLYTIKCGRYSETLKCDGIPSSTNQKFYRNIDNKWKEIII